jgi:hypothetical protein
MLARVKLTYGTRSQHVQVIYGREIGSIMYFMQSGRILSFDAADARREKPG